MSRRRAGAKRRVSRLRRLGGVEVVEVDEVAWASGGSLHGA
jgi:hypothetical protein